MNTFNNVRNVFFNFTLSSWDGLLEDNDWEDDDSESLYAVNSEYESEETDSSYNPDTDSECSDEENLSSDEELDEESSSICSLDDVEQEELDMLEEEAGMSILDLGRAYRARGQ